MKGSYWFLVNFFIYLASFMLLGSHCRQYTHGLLTGENPFTMKFPYDTGKGLVFFVKACKEAYVGVFQKYAPEEEFQLIITVLIGRQSNNYNYVAFRNTTKGGAFLKYTTVSEMPTNCYEYRPFWVNATINFLSVGSGTVIGKSQFLEMHHNLNGNGKVPNFMSFASSLTVESDWVWESCDDVVDPWASWSNCTEHGKMKMKTRTRQNLTEPFEWNGKICFDSETESIECSSIQRSIKWVKMIISNSNTSEGLKQIFEAKSKIKCASMCSWTGWCEYFQYLKQNDTCILIEDVSRAEPTSYNRRIVNIHYNI